MFFRTEIAALRKMRAEPHVQNEFAALFFV